MSNAHDLAGNSYNNGANKKLRAPHGVLISYTKQFVCRYIEIQRNRFEGIIIRLSAPTLPETDCLVAKPKLISKFALRKITPFSQFFKSFSEHIILHEKKFSRIILQIVDFLQTVGL